MDEGKLFTLRDKVALVTGGSGGLGEAVVRLFVELGAQVIIGDVLEDSARELAEAIGDAAFPIGLDVSNEKSWAAALEKISARFDRVDILVNNAGIWGTTALENMALSEFQRTLDINQTGVFLGMRDILPLMKQQGGSIVNVSSVAGVRPYQGRIAYAGAKFGVRGLTKVAALELAPYNIRVNAVLPGMILTARIEARLADPVVQDKIAELPMQRAGAPIEIARVIAFLASDAASYMTGSDVVVDGGMLTGSNK